VISTSLRENSTPTLTFIQVLFIELWVSQLICSLFYLLFHAWLGG